MDSGESSAAMQLSLESVVRACLAMFWFAGLSGIAGAYLFPQISAMSSYGIRSKPLPISFPKPPNMRLFGGFGKEIGVDSKTGWTFIYSVALGASMTALAASCFPPDPDVPIALALLVLQALRRLLEALYIHKHSVRPLNPVVVLGGVLFYLAAPLTLSCSSSVCATFKPHPPTRVALAVELFAAASVGQNHIHRALAGAPPLRGKYGVARGGLFELVCCPHYTAEIAIYVCFFVLCPGVLVFAMLAFVAGNLSVSALETAKWYLRTFPAEFLPRNRKVRYL